MFFKLLNSGTADIYLADSVRVADHVFSVIDAQQSVMRSGSAVNRNADHFRQFLQEILIYPDIAVLEVYESVFRKMSFEHIQCFVGIYVKFADRIASDLDTDRFNDISCFELCFST